MEVEDSAVARSRDRHSTRRWPVLGGTEARRYGGAGCSHEQGGKAARAHSLEGVTPFSSGRARAGSQRNQLFSAFFTTATVCPGQEGGRGRVQTKSFREQDLLDAIHNAIDRDLVARSDR